MSIAQKQLEISTYYGAIKRNTQLLRQVRMLSVILEYIYIVAIITVTKFYVDITGTIWTRQAKYVKRDTEGRSYNHCCSVKSISITYSECPFLDLGIQHAMRMHHVVICGLPGCIGFFSTLSPKLLEFRKNVSEHNLCTSIFCTTFARKIFHSKKNWTRY
jgi:hypothetical protein